MNRHLYRLLFNQRRGQLMAVAESAVAAGKTAGTTGNQGRPRRILRAVLRGVTFGVLIALGLAAVLPNANAQIVAYKTAPASQRPTILTASNGVPLINIQTPSAGGVSRNTYSQFDVQAEGAILNNARTNAATQLGGWVQGNPWLAKGSARVILNEIVSSNPSLLSGYLEVAGDRAQVIVANPAGVTCSGCGFLNASRATLTTGTPMVSGGNLDGYRVEGGSVRIEGAGLDASRVDVTDLIARAVEVNAGIWAHTLKVTAGTNQIDAAHTQAVPIAGQGSAPAFAIDVAALGGMYAGKITLVGTEAGVGVRNAGELGAAAGNIVITADGQLVNSGTLSAASNITLNTDAVLQNRGLISAGQTLDVQTGTLDNATTRSGDRGLEGRTVSLIAEHLNNAGGAIRADTVATITSSGTLDNGNGLITSAGTMAIRDSAPTRTLAVTNSTGTVIAGQSLAIDVASLGGDGSLLSEGDLAISLAADYTHTGQLAANGQVTVSTAGDLINHGTLESGTAMAISAESLDNQAGGEIAAPELTLVASAAHTLTNRGLIDGSDTRINAISLNNLGTGRIYGDDLAIAATTLNNDAETVGGSLESPVIAARNRLDIGVGTLNNRNGAVMFSASDLFIGGALDADDHATGQAVTVNNHAATVESLGHLAIAADAITNTNAGLVTSTVIESTQHIQEVQPEGWSHRYDVSFFPHIFNYGVEDQTYVVNGVVQGGFEDYTFYDYAGTTSATEVLSSLPGQILSGGDLILSGNLTNADSRIIAGGTLLQTGGMLNNTSTEGTRTTTYSGWAQFRDWDGNDEELEFGPHYAFSPAPVVTSFNLGIARFDANTVPTGSGTTIAAMNLSGPGQTADGAGGLFIPTTDPTAHYVIETDPRFAGYASVTEQSGFKAGDAGFQVKVEGDTDLKGAVIASSQRALDEDRNEFETGGALSTEAIQNHAEYEAKSASVNLGSSMSFDGKLKPGGTGVGFGEDGGKAESTTRSGISGVAGNTDVRTGDPESGIKPIFDQETVQKEIEAQTRITQLFGQQAPKAAADFAASQAADLRKQGNEEEAKKWDEGGTYRIALHTVIGGLAGGVEGAVGAGAVATAAPLLNELQTNVTIALKEAGVNDTVAKLAGQLVTEGTAAGIGAAASGGSIAGTAMAFNVDANNRQLHPEETQWLKRKAKEFAKKEGISEQEALERLTQQALKEVDYLWRAQLTDGDDTSAKAFLATTQDAFTNDLGEQQRLFTTSGQQLFRPEMFAETSDPSFFQQFAQSGISRSLSEGLIKEIKDSGIDVKNSAIDLAKLAKDNPGVVLSGIWSAVADLPGSIVDSFKETGGAIGEGAAVALNDDISARLNAIYGADVSGAQKALLAIRITSAITGAAGTAKAATQTTEAAAKAILKKLDDVLDKKTLEILVKSGGVLENGSPLLDLKQLTVDQKRIMGELFGENTVKQIVPDGKKLASLQGVGTNGIDDLYKVSRADVDYVVIEYKFVGSGTGKGSTRLEDTLDGLQASESWTLGSGRLEKAVGVDKARDVLASTKMGRMETWVVTTRPDGATVVEVLDALGKPKSIDTSKILNSGISLSGAKL